MISNIFKRLFQFILLIVMILFIIALVVGSMLGISFIKIAKSSPEVNPESIMMDLNENSTILDKDGNVIEEVASEEYRDIVAYEEIPKHLKQAFINVEDERFWQHKGVDLQGVAKSAIDNFKAGGIVRGGSTITQQLVRNMYLNSDVQWERKIQEMYMALKVTDKISRENILEAYLNRVYLGQHAYGVQAASQIYFSKDVKDLTVAQAATLAGIVKSPSNYSLFNAYYPKNVPDNAKILGDFYVAGENLVAVLNEDAFKRKDYVLQKMHENGALTDKEYKEAIKEDVVASIKPGSKKQIDYSSHISKLIKDETLEILMKKKNISKDEASNLLYTGGLKIKTTIDWDVQGKLEKAYDNMTETMSKYNEGNNPLMADLKLDNAKNVINNTNRVLYFLRKNLLTKNNELILRESNFTKTKKGNLRISSERVTSDGEAIYVSSFYDINDKNNMVTYKASSMLVPPEYIEKKKDFTFEIKKEFLDKNPDFYRITDSGDMRISSKYFTVDKKGTLQPQSATVIIDHSNGHIVALVGARGKSPDDTIDRANSFTRAPASSIKPLAVYSPALENGYTLATALDDVPRLDHTGKIWPRNVYKGFKGLVPLRKALAESINTTAVQVLKDVGLKTSIEYLKDFGLINDKDGTKDNFITRKENPDSNDENLGLAIGSLTRGFTVKEMASAYSALANGGVRHDDTVIMSIESDKEGEIYNEENKSTRVVTEETAWLLTDVLKGALDDDPQKRAANDFGIDVAAKTGTSNNNADFWIAGYNPYYTSATWLGFDNNNISLIGNSYNVRTFFASFMNPIIKDKKPKKFDKPKTIVKEKVDKLSGLLPNKYTASDPRGGMIVEEYFAKGTVPKKVSQAHVSLRVDRRNNLLASSSTPSYLAVNRVFQKRAVPFNPEAFDESQLPEDFTLQDLIPEDWKYEAPTKYSTLKWGPTRETIKNSDGSTTVKVTAVNGRITETTTYPDGRVVIKVTDTDGTVTITERKPVEEKPQPEEPKPQPEEPQPQPEEPKPQPEEPQPQPEEPKPQPEEPQPQPEEPKPEQPQPPEVPNPAQPNNGPKKPNKP